MAFRKELVVFLVDDDQMFLDALEHSLTQEKNNNVVVNSFLTGEDCLEHMHLNPDIVVLDHNLASESRPNCINGMTVLKKIRQINDNIPVIMLSGQDNIDIALETINNGAFEYVVKSESAFIRIQKIIDNINAGLKLKANYEKQDFYYKLVAIIIISIFILAFIYTRLFSETI